MKDIIIYVFIHVCQIVVKRLLQKLHIFQNSQN